MSLLDLLKVRLDQGRQTLAYPTGSVNLPSLYRGRPTLDPAKCPDGCRECASACPTDAVVDVAGRGLAIDMARCLFCSECTDACPAGAIAFTNDFRLAARTREELVVQRDEAVLAKALDAKARALFGRSLKLRLVCAGGCSGCEAELNAAGNIQFDMGRFGIQFVASPRHADGLVVTGPLTDNMLFALRKTREAMPEPRLVIAVGACALSGGPFRGNPEQHDGCAGAVPVDLWVPGCPPHPLTFVDGLLRLLGRVEGSRAQPADHQR